MSSNKKNLPEKVDYYTKGRMHDHDTMHHYTWHALLWCMTRERRRIPGINLNRKLVSKPLFTCQPYSCCPSNALLFEGRQRLKHLQLTWYVCSMATICIHSSFLSCRAPICLIWLLLLLLLLLETGKFLLPLLVSSSSPLLQRSLNKW